MPTRRLNIRVNEQIFMIQLNAWSGYARELENRLQELAGADGIDGVPVDQWITWQRESWHVPPRPK